MPPKLQRVHAAETLTDQAQTALKNAIMTGQMRPGEMHSVAELAAQLGVSRTPVREAVLQLARLGMVEIRRNQGVVVLEPSAADVHHIYEIRVRLEVPATETAAVVATAAEKASIRKAHAQMTTAAEAGDQAQTAKYDALFHSRIIQAAGNPRVVAIIGDLRDLLVSRNQITIGKSQSLIEVAHDHDEILSAIEAGDGVRAASAMKLHLDQLRDGVTSLIEREV